MTRFLPLALLAAFFAVPAPAEAGPLKRLRDRIQARFAPSCPSCPAPAQTCPACVPCANGSCALPKQVPQPAPKVVAQAKAAAEPKVVEGRLADRAKLELVRLLAIQHAVREGVPNGDGTFKKVTRAQARKLADQVTDEQILKGMVVYGAPAGEGRLESLFDWILEHKEEIAELVKWVVSLFALFADGN